MSLDEIKELNNKWQKDKNIAYEYNGTELQTLNGEHIGVDLMLSDEGLELQVCKVIGFNNQNEKMWETFAIESIDIDKINSDNELENYLQERIDEYETEIKNDNNLIFTIINDNKIDLCKNKIIEEYHKEDICMAELLSSIKCINLSVEDNYDLYKDLVEKYD